MRMQKSATSGRKGHILRKRASTSSGSREITLVTIHDRPLKTELGEYHYLIECGNCSYDTFEELKEKTGLELRYLGSFAVK